MQSVQEIISLIRAQCDRTAVDFENELSSYDRKRNGLISPVSLHRWISSIGLNLSSQQVQLVANAFKKDDGVEWEELANALNNSRKRQHEVSTRTAPCVEQLKMLASNLAKENITLVETMKQYDAYNRGRVAPEQLYKAFGYNSLTREIVKYYADTITGYIDYIKLDADIKAVGIVHRDPDAPLTDLPEPFEDLARYIKSRSIDLSMLFNKIDFTNQGKVSQPQFTAAISSIGISIKPNYLNQIAACFTDPETGLSNYKQFIATVESFRPKPTEKVRMATLRSEQMKPRFDVDELLENLKEVIRSRRINVRDYFSTLQREGYGETIPIRVFVQIIESMRASLSPDEINAIGERFTVGDQQVDYNAFLKAILPQVTTRTITKQDVIPRLQKFLQEQHRSFAVLAQRYDRENSGCVSANQLISIFQLLKFEVTNPEIALFRDFYPGKTRGTISWKDISADVDVKDQSFTTTRLPNNDEMPRRDPNMIGKPPKQVNEILLAIQKFTKNQNVSLDRIFNSYDRRGIGRLTSADFTDALRDARIPINQSDMRIIQSFFRVQPTPDVDYRVFLDAVRLAEPEPEEAPAPEPQREKEMPALQPAVHNFLRRFKSFAQSRRISVVDIFVPYDTTKQGIIQVYKVPAAFNNVHFQANRSELEDVCSAFRDPKKNEIFNYILFNKAVEAEDITTEAARSAIENDPISAEINHEALATCLQIREKCMSRRRRIASVFADVKTDTIPYSDFQRRLDNLNIVLRAGQLNSLYRKYRYGMSEEIRWRDFCNDVENSKTVGF